MAKTSALLLALLAAFLGVTFGSVSDGGEGLVLPKAELSRSKRSPGGTELCPCPGMDAPKRHKHHCPCDHFGFFFMTEEPHRRRRRRHHHHPHHPHHHHGRKAKHHLQQRKNQCLRFLKHCLRRQISIPL
ncbi:uncharacterized protein LOC134293725 isoform X3 [Anolis carolinensis]|uniref:uncharacterized protein LOC134293725 isoform X3 n=1 Tax=Anolis carolinensis TaxID=28377 RepID=UPI002F2B15AA